MNSKSRLTRGMLSASAALPLAFVGTPSSAQTAQTQGEPTASSSSSSIEPATQATNEGAGQTAPTQIDSTAQAPADPSATGNQDIVVTGYRASLQSQANAKRRSVGFTDTIFAEDIGKFPDTNIAESVNRIPGVTISREVTGEGANVTIRGLGTNFTRVLLNGAPVAVASVRFDAQSTNREVDLDLLPTELFTQLTVSKSPVPSQLEGGAAGTVNLRSARPFDNPKPYISYGLQGTKNSNADKWGYRGHVLASRTFGNFGVLIGGAVARNEFRVDGYETIGFTNANLTAAQRSGTRNQTGSGNFTIPGTVPANAGNGLTVGAPINEAFLLANNPGATIDQIDNGILPRLSRPRDEVGFRQRYNGIASVEWRPSDALHFYVDGMYGHRKTDFIRSDLNWSVRNSAPIPLNTTYDRQDCATGCVVTSGTYANSQFFLEFRPYMDDQDYWGVNPGAEFEINDWIKGDFQANYTKSDFHRESPTVLVITPPSSGITVNYANDGGVPQVTSNIDLNDPANFGWYGGARVNLNGEDRKTKTKGVRGSLLFGDASRISARIGGAYDVVQRRITPFDNTNPWSNLICGNGPSITLQGPNTAALPCTGLSVTGTQVPGTPIAAGFPAYAGYGTGFTAGGAPIVYSGSLIPNSLLGNYLRPNNDTGFITVDWDRFAADTNYEGFLADAGETRTGSSGANGGLVRENVLGAFAELNGNVDVGEDTIRFNGGVRYARTDQIIGGVISVPDIRNNPPGGTPIADGGRYPNQIIFLENKTRYKNWLPSFSIAYDFNRKAVARASISKTMTRPDPNALLPGASFVQPSADVGTIGNQELDPYISTNIDLGFEYYTGGEGVIAFAAFRKSITGFTVNGTTRQPLSFLAPYGITFDSLTLQQRLAICGRLGFQDQSTCPGANEAEILLTQQVNSDGKLKVNGLEFQLTQPLDFITDRWGFGGLGVQANLTLIDQKGEGAGAPATALGVSPKTYNLTGYYDRDGISARLSYTFNEGAQGTNPGQNGFVAPLGVIWGRDYKQLDFSGNVDLSKIMDNRYLPTVVLNLINITNESQGSYFDYPNAVFNQYNPGRTLMLGIRGRI